MIKVHILQNKRVVKRLYVRNLEMKRSSHVRKVYMFTKRNVHVFLLNKHSCIYKFMWLQIVVLWEEIYVNVTFT